MLKKLTKYLRSKLLKIEWISREVKRYKIEQEIKQIEQQKQQHYDDWTELMRSGGTVRADERVIIVDYMDGRKVCWEHVVPAFIDSVIWGKEDASE